MNAMRCQYESEMIRALQVGALTETQIAHQKSCADCRDAMLVVQALQRDASDITARYTPPSSAMVWAAAERQRRMAALVRAMRFLNVLKIAGVVYVAVLVFWALHSVTVRGVVTLPGLDGKLLNTTIEGAGLAVLLVGSGLWYMLRRDERLTN